MGHLVNLINKIDPWTPEDFQKFLENLDDNLLSTIYHKSDEDDKELININQIINEVSRLTNLSKVKEVTLILEKHKIAYEKQKRLRLVNSIIKFIINKTSTKFSVNELLDYHNLLLWNASNIGIPTLGLINISTFKLEKMIYEKSFANMWEEMSKKKREEFLKGIKEKYDRNNSLDVKATLALGGAAALTAVAGAVSIYGFAAYMALSSIIYSAASLLGLGVAFTGYMGASTALSIISGPAGWITAGVLFLIGFSRKNSKKRRLEISLFISSIYLIKLKIIEDNK